MKLLIHQKKEKKKKERFLKHLSMEYTENILLISFVYNLPSIMALSSQEQLSYPQLSVREGKLDTIEQDY
jgi:hypothetical protein